MSRIVLLAVAMTDGAVFASPAVCSGVTPLPGA
jgi:hypothetical protein